MESLSGLAKDFAMGGRSESLFPNANYIGFAEMATDLNAYNSGVTKEWDEKAAHGWCEVLSDGIIAMSKPSRLHYKAPSSTNGNVHSFADVFLQGLLDTIKVQGCTLGEFTCKSEGRIPHVDDRVAKAATYVVEVHVGESWLDSQGNEVGLADDEHGHDEMEDRFVYGPLSRDIHYVGRFVRGSLAIPQTITEWDGVTTDLLQPEQTRGCTPPQTVETPTSNEC